MVSVERLTKRYESFMLDASISIPKGRVIGLIGKNGAGKSTLIKAILGLIRPDAGRVTVFGTEAGSLSASEKERIGAAFPDSGFSDELNINSIAKILESMYGSFDKNAFLSTCRGQGLDVNKRTGDFSTGMKAKLKVLVAVSHKADLLILDEPTAGLDVEARNEILDLLRDYLASDENRSILITSHIATDLENICDEIYLIHGGKIVLHEETDVILSEYGVVKTDAQSFELMDKAHILSYKKEKFGYSCFTDDVGYYRKAYPELVAEKAGIDDLILYLAGGK